MRGTDIPCISYTSAAFGRVLCTALWAFLELQDVIEGGEGAGTGERGCYPHVAGRLSTMFSTEVIVWALTLLNLVLTSCALWAAITARSSLKALRRKLAERATRSLRQLDATVTEHESVLSKLTLTTRRLSSRSGMQDLRQRRQQESAMPDLATATKSQLRLMLQTGRARAMREHPGQMGAAKGASLNGGAEPDDDDDH